MKKQLCGIVLNGVFCYGANDCEYSGEFFMKQVMSNFNPIIKNNISINYPIFSPDSLIHKWQLSLVSKLEI